MIANKPSENVAEFKFLGMTVVTQNDIKCEIKRDSCSCLAQNLMPSCILSKNPA